MLLTSAFRQVLVEQLSLAHRQLLLPTHELLDLYDEMQFSSDPTDDRPKPERGARCPYRPSDSRDVGSGDQVIRQRSKIVQTLGIFRRSVTRTLASEPVGRVIGALSGQRVPSHGLRINTRHPYLNPTIEASLFWRLYERGNLQLILRHLRGDRDVIDRK